MRRIPGLIGLIIVFASACKGGKVEQNVPIPEKESIYNVQILQSKLGKKLWKLKAKSIMENGDTLTFYKLYLQFFSPHGKVSSELTADSGKLYKKTEDMEAFGNVKVLFFKDSTRVYTSYIKYDSKKRLISGNKRVKIVTPKGVIMGTGFISDPEMNHIKIFGQVKGYGKG